MLVMRNNDIHDFRSLKVFVRLEVQLLHVTHRNCPAQEFAIYRLQFDTRWYLDLDQVPIDHNS